MSKIKVMSFDLASKIAAGEVVENQSSVVKELIENAIDANANKITINLIDSGIQLIEVTDNGSGMDKEDILLSVKEHATSKITNEYELFNIETLGFRGEALASIKAVSKLKISSNNGSETGYTYDVFTDSINAGYDVKGSKISVYNLFYNVPARFKYLDSTQKELSKIVEIVTRFALANTHIAFVLINDNKTLINTNGNKDMLQIINNIYSLDVAKSMIKINKTDNDFNITGYISDKETTRSNKKNIYVYINNRLVFNKELSNSVIAGYDDYLMEKRYPIAFINITCDFQLIDVNVHPAKLEVRISKVDQLKETIINTIKETFNIARKQFITKEKIIQPTLNFTYEIEDNISEKELTSFNETRDMNIQEEKDILKEVDNVKINLVDKQTSEQTLNIDKPILNITDTTNKDYSLKEDLEEAVVKEIETAYVSFSAIGQFDGSYILAQNQSGLHIIDQHAAMERINYENKLKKINDPLEFQELVVPIVIPLTFSQKLKILEVSDKLFSIGIKIEESATNDLIIREVPLWIDINNANLQIQNAIEHILELNKVSIKDISKEGLILASCKMSLKANTRLDIKEQQQLLDKLVTTPNYDRCPHGRPIIITMSKYEVEKMFKRII
ncbi:DNA mismatch repair endonuclease MutL [Mycoplasma sp. P36-A1]|uniref:DNA mismatch repair endonuclease MutL n=1 Tax=Mycoplasma sp. P36-A1 TaxID=3252900 RepID=UPI003C2B8C3F